jgi:hypothetical protein
VLYLGTTTSHVSFIGVNVHGVAGSGTPAVTIAGTGNSIEGADITNPTNGTCVQVGPSAAQRATDARLDGDAIHSCGDPSGNLTASHADGLGVSYADGTRVSNSYFYGNSRHGITLGPDAQHSEIDHNVIDRQRNGMGDGEGVQFAGDDKTSSNNNVVEANLISDNEFVNVGYNWNGGAGTPGSGNAVRANCISNSANPSGEFQTDPSTHQPVGYSEEGNVVGSDPQYVNRDAPPAGYALPASSPCLSLASVGPLAAATTDPAVVPPPDPEAAHVFTAQLAGDVDPHLQPAAVHFEWGRRGRPLASIGAQQVDAVGMPVPLLSQTLTGLKPATTYAFRLVPDTPKGSAPGATITFRTAPAPPLAPPLPTISYGAKVKRKGRVKGTSLPDLAVENVGGSTVTVRCSPRPPCPFKGERTGKDAVRLLRRSVFRPGGRIYIEVDPKTPVGRYRGRLTTIRIGRVKKGVASVPSDDTCVLATGGRSDCLYPLAPFFPAHSYSVFRGTEARGVSRGTTVDYVCLHGKCPRFPACRTVARGLKDVKLLPDGQRVKAGVRFRVRFLKPDTRGVAATIAVHPAHGRNGDTDVTQRNSFLRPSVQHSGQCRDA